MTWHKEYRLLLIGDFYSVYMINFVKSLKRENPNAHIYFWGADRDYEGGDDTDYLNCFERYHLFSLNVRNPRLPIVRTLQTIPFLRNDFISFVDSEVFDFINIHFVEFRYVFLLDCFKRVSSKLVLSPWGSDVYRISRKEKFFLKFLYNSADFISGQDDRFTKDIMHLFNVPKSKFVPVLLNSATIDYIIENKDSISTKDAKSRLGLEDSYVITCGYNGNPAQQHLRIVDAINSVRADLPEKLTLLFPLTYGGSTEYKAEIKKKIKECKLAAFFYEDFLDLSGVFLLRQATDMFIHMQTTDAGSSSLREYMLCGKKIINGSWLHYDDLEQDGIIPYFVANDFDSLGKTIVAAYKSAPKVISENTQKVLERKSSKYTITRTNHFFCETL